MKYLIRTILITAVAIAAPLSAAWAQTCTDDGLDIVLDRLEERYQEQIVYSGMTSRGELFYLMSSSTGTFTVVLHSPNGVSCAVIAGHEGNSTMYLGELLRGDLA